MVELLGGLVKLLNIIQHVVATKPNQRVDTPHHNRRVVVVLDNCLTQLLQAVLLELIGCVVEYVAEVWRASKWSVNPHQLTHLVAAIVEVLRVWGCCRANGVGSDVVNLSHIFVVVASAYSATNSCTVVVECNAVNGDPLAVDFQTIWCVLNLAETGCNRNNILLARADAYANRVEAWVVAAPELWIVDSEWNLDWLVPLNLGLQVAGIYRIAIGCTHHNLHIASLV